VNQKKFRTREPIQIKLSTKDTVPGSVFVSVRKMESKAKELEDKNRGFYSPVITTNEISPNSNFLPEVRGKIFSGRVLKNDPPVKGEKVYLSIPAKDYFFSATITDSEGRFYFNVNKIKFNAEGVVQVDSTICSNCRIEKYSEGLSDYSAFKPSPLKIDSTYRRLIEARSLSMQIENAYFENKKDSIKEPVEILRFYGKPDVTYGLDDYTRFPTMEDVLVEYIGDIVLRKKSNEFEVRIKDTRRGIIFENTPLILIDGIPIFNTNHLMHYNPFLIEKIEIVNRRYFYGPLEADGVISISTYEGNARNLAGTREKFDGIQAHKKYFSPAYNSKLFNRIPDNRIQLYWNPLMEISNKPLALNFYSSDLKGDFEIKIGGILANGKQIQFTETIHVE
ncbi:MAG TPA: hypothetical protein DGG95_11340, partial [Cytophagales bacterium]|nr:hypothetical protein [Cytophagales bacterium]